MIRRLAALLAVALATPALAAPVADCPLRDRPFSLDMPLIDALLSPAARAVIEREIPGKLDKLPPRFGGTEPPTFAAILSVREGVGFLRGPAEAAARIDAGLRALPVTAADRVARCARYDDERPKLDAGAGRPRVLLFEKINGFRDVPSVDAAHAAFLEMARRKGWAIAVTDKGGAFTPATLKRFDAVIWNNVSGDVLTLAQRRAFQDWLNGGGAFVGVHGSAGDPVYFWDWYPDKLIGARFAGHPMNPQFQEARVAVQATGHPVAAGLPAEWRMRDEWYSFKSNPRAAGAEVIATLDERTYKPDGQMGQQLRMGDDHPIAWTNCIGRGRMFYSAIGHLPETYSEPTCVRMLENAVGWITDPKTNRCPAAK